jgi:hypothetical protein
MEFKLNKETVGASQSKSQMLSAGIHKVHIKSTEKISGTSKEGKEWSAFKINLESEKGAINIALFMPTSEDDMKRISYPDKKNGGTRDIPSNVETLLLKIQHILDSFNPEVAKKIQEEGITIKSTDSLCASLTKWLEPAIKKGTEANVKVVPNNKKVTYNEVVKNPCSLTKDGTTARISNNFLGDNLSFTPYEVDLIERQKVELDDIRKRAESGASAGMPISGPSEDLNAPSIEDEADDLPF